MFHLHKVIYEQVFEPNSFVSVYSNKGCRLEKFWLQFFGMPRVIIRFMEYLKKSEPTGHTMLPCLTSYEKNTQEERPELTKKNVPLYKLVIAMWPCSKN